MRVQPFSYLEQKELGPPPLDTFRFYLSSKNFGQFDGQSFGNGIVKFDVTGQIDTSFNANITYSDATMPRYMTYIDGNVLYLSNSNIIVIDGITGVEISRSTLSGITQAFALTRVGNYAYVSSLSPSTLGSYQGQTVSRYFRVDKDGVLDTTFLTNRPNLNFGPAYFSAGPSGKIFIAGGFTSATTGHGAFQVLNENGTVDTAFMDNRALDGDFNNAGRAAVLVDNDLIVVTGNFTSMGGTTYNRIIGFNLDGTLNTTFNSGVTTGASANLYFAWPLFTNKIIVTSFTASFNYNGTGVNRSFVVNKDGTLDTVSTGYFGTGFNNLPLYFRPDSNGNIWVTGEGYTTFNGVSYSNIVQINMNTGVVNPTYVYVSGMRTNTGANITSAAFFNSLVSNQ